MSSWTLLLLTAGCRAPEGTIHSIDPTPGDDPAVLPTTPGLDADGDGFETPIDCDDADPEVHAKVTVDDERYYDDLGLALSEASAGSTVVVCAGTYQGPFVSAVPVALSSIDGAEVTHLSGGGSTPVLVLPGGSSVSGFTVENGQVDGEGGGILQATADPLTIEDCVVSGNHARHGGGIAGAVGGTLLLTRTTVTANVAEGGGGLYVAAGGRAELVESTVDHNTGSFWGGGVHLDGAELVGGTITANLCDRESIVGGAPSGGGGVSASGTSSITGARIEDNEAPAGGGFSIVGGDLTLTDTTVTGNRATPLPGVGPEGGGGFADDSTLALVNTTLTLNDSVTGGGGLSIWSSVVDGGTIDANTAEWGAGVYLYGGALRGVTITNNVAGFNGGGVMASRDSEIVDCDISSNRATTGMGGGIHAVGNPETVVTNTTLVGNSAPKGGGIAVGYAAITGGAITDNQADEGAGLYLQNPEEEGSLGRVFGVYGVTVARNVAAVRGGGAAMNDYTYYAPEAHATLVSEASDWGSDGNDNQPGDVSYLWNGDGQSPPEASFGADASFSCTDEGCVP